MDEGGSKSHWRTEFLSSAAREVRDAIGAVIVCIERPEGISPSVPESSLPPGTREKLDRHIAGLKDLLDDVAEVRSLIDEERGGLGDVPGVVVVVGEEKEAKQDQEHQQHEDKGDHARIDDGAARVDEFGALGSARKFAEAKQVSEYGAGWWEEELSQIGVFEFEVVNWDPKIEEVNEKRNMFGGM